MLNAFTSHFGIDPGAQPRQLLAKVVHAFARIPYENITKIIKHEECGSPKKARRYPGEVIRDHIAWGAGGTCFSLTSALLYLLRNLGWKAECILADRRYGQDTHCALLVWIDDVPHLLDPGFLILNPIPLIGREEREIETGFNRLILSPDEGEDRVALASVRRNTTTYRLTYKTSPVDYGQFLKAWDASFNWDMMQYPLLTRTLASSQIYLRGAIFQVSNTDCVERQEVAHEDLISKIAGEFQISPKLVVHALTILKKGGAGG